MTSGTHDPELLGAYTLGALDAHEEAAVEAHLAGCEQCRAELRELDAVRGVLGELPPEAFLDGPPPEGVQAPLRATIQRAGAERAVQRRRRALRLALAAVLAGVVLAGIGVVTGRVLAPAAPPQAEVTRLASGTVVAAQEDPDTGASATVRLEPESTGLRLESFITGIPEGEECEVVVVTADGRAEVAAAWTVSAESASAGSRPGGFADVAPQDVASVVVRNTADTEFVTIVF
ncbi:zf-HC2 domain-containing protein [Nocardiopsis sp. YSL2]|uniref:anti-sigma factor n=1 Tax=Nocardiopsis sp. YSL2 TaxID=2939492 RepID=UPI0026F46A60|nr:zf-HC2 domain-containing protein [Nocardiopsis sp. YSL2]